MDAFMCVTKFRDKNGIIVGYRLLGTNSDTRDVKPDWLKKAIRSGNVKVLNLKLTSDNRLIDYDKKRKESESLVNKVNTIIKKAKLLGKYRYEHDLHYMDISQDMVIVYIPHDVKKIEFGAFDIDKKIIKVIGGVGLDSVTSMFQWCKADCIDLTELDTSNVKHMSNMFLEANINEVDLSSLKTSNVVDMHGMFREAIIEKINLKGIDTSSVINMDHMFDRCTVKSLDLSSFNTSNVSSMKHMFDYCKLDFLDVSSFNTSRVKHMYAMFHECDTDKLDLISFDLSNADLSFMFAKCRAKNIIVKNDYIGVDVDALHMFSNTLHMFSGCTAHNRELREFRTKNNI